MNTPQLPTRKHLYAFLNDEEYHTLTTLIGRMEFPTLSAYITAVCRTTLYGWQTKYHVPSGELDPETADWIAWHKNHMTKEDRLRQTYFDILTDLAFPVIASRGAQLAFHLLQNEIETAMAEQAGMLPSYDQLKTWTQVYETIHAEQLGRHRADLARDTAQETEHEMI
ncbi:hypothetical protein O0S10_06720 [Methanocorpusculum sp. MG]|uniref:Uncharacterized protein n=1 Tax=Methanocorpusculum petauri TaxID=3002863 RepID=A0ABT4IGP7_9EURY|nr:hypothetical protein [Methanocorpusculum petauri]MCZ0860918.1 hypothetical protein [Methanocorpusculum petauri]